jgi:hypothetical protein
MKMPIPTGFEKECKCRSDFSGTDGLRKIELKRSYKKFQFYTCDVEDFNIEPCNCKSCLRKGFGKLYAIEIADNDIIVMMPHDFEHYFITLRQERWLKLKRINEIRYSQAEL